MSGAAVGVGRLRVGQKMGFGVGDLGGNLVFSVIGFWCLNYLTDTVGLSSALAGLALMAGKAWDAVTDPLMGFISDRTVTPLGRRRPFLLAGALPMGFAMWFFFTAPPFVGQGALALWAALALIFFNTCTTVISIPYSSLTPELTSDYHEQTSLNGYRFGFAVFGTLIGAAAVQPLVNLAGGGRRGFSTAGLVLGALVTLTTLLTFLGTREKRRTRGGLPREGFFATYKAVFSNRPYLILVVTYMLHISAITVLQGIIVYYTKYIYHDELMATGAMALLLVVAMVFIPVSVLVSRRVGKKAVYMACFTILALSTGAIFLLGHVLGKGFFYVVMTAAGVGVGFSYVAPYAMVPDTVAYDASRTGSRKEGAYYGMWTFFSKIGAALAACLSGLILAFGGYAPEAEQGAGALLAIRLLAGPVPLVIFVAAFFLMRRYPLDEAACAAFAEFSLSQTEGGEREGGA